MPFFVLFCRVFVNTETLWNSHCETVRSLEEVIDMSPDGCSSLRQQDDLDKP